MYELIGFQRDILSDIAGFDEPLGLTVKEELKQRMNPKFTMGDSIRTPTQ